MKKKEIVHKIIRIKVKDLQAYEKTSKSWKKTGLRFPEISYIIGLFRAHDNFKLLVDKKDPRFLKGELYDSEPKGARINQIPDGKMIDKAYSLFAKDLRIHDQDSEDHWDVMYQNKGGTYSYCYTLEKKKNHRSRKYHKVMEFAKVYGKLFRNVSKALNNEEDHLSLAMYTLLKTHMRVGNEIYYKAHGHKGLTTLKKKDVSIKGQWVRFNYLAKDGVPRLIEHKFPKLYVEKLRIRLRSLKQHDFVFSSCRTGHPLQEKEFKKAFVKYCGKEFYPHIVRSYYATSQVKKFLKGRKRLDKDEVKKLYLSIAAELGHKRFIRKEKLWKDNYTVTINHYIQPELVEKVKRLIG